MNVRMRITIAEPSAIIRDGMISALRKAGGLHAEVFEVDEMAKLKSAISVQKPGVLIVNPANLGSLSVAAIRKEAGPGLRIVALQLFMMDSGVLRNYDETISIYDNPAQIGEKLAGLVAQPEQDKRRESLSEREKEIVVCVVQGMTNKQIADKLFLSTHTVVTHRRNISAKLDIHSTAGLAIYAIVNKLVELS